MPLTPEQEEFLLSHRFGVLTTIKASGAPQATPVYYLYEDGKILMSANTWKHKTRNIQRDPRVTLCVLGEQHPFRYLQVSGQAAVTQDELVETSTRIFRKFRDELPEDFAGWLREQERVVLVLSPESAFPATPERR